MNKNEIIAAIAKKARNTLKNTERLLKYFILITEKELKKGGDVKLAGFGTFKIIRKSGSTLQILPPYNQ